MRCSYCKKSMKEADGCTFNGFYADSEQSVIYRVKHKGTEPCTDCNAKPGFYHHCDCEIEVCGCCGGMLDDCPCHEGIIGELSPVYIEPEGKFHT